MMPFDALPKESKKARYIRPLNLLIHNTDEIQLSGIVVKLYVSTFHRDELNIIFSNNRKNKLNLVQS